MVVARGEDDAAIVEQAAGGGCGRRPALEQACPDRRALDRAAHGRPVDRRAAVEEHPVREPGDDLACGENVDETRLGPEDPLDRVCIGRRDRPADLVRRIILEGRQQQPELAIPRRRWPPVEGHDGRTGGADRIREAGQADVDRAHAIAERTGRRSGGHQSAADTISGGATRVAVRSGGESAAVIVATATIDAASMAARALLDSSMTPVWARIRSWRVRPCGSRSVPHTDAMTRRCRPAEMARAIASAIAGASASAGSGWEPWPRTTSRSTIPIPGSSAVVRTCPLRSRGLAIRAASSKVAAGNAPTASTIAGSPPRKFTTTGFDDERTASRIRAATIGDGGLEIRTITAVAGSASSWRSAASIVIPPTRSSRSRPPVPKAFDTPDPSRWMSDVTSWMPVPDAPTTPI